MSTRKPENRELETTLICATGALDVTAPVPQQGRRRPGATSDQESVTRRQTYHPSKHHGIVFGALTAILIVAFPAWSATSGDAPAPSMQATMIIAPSISPKISSSRNPLSLRQAGWSPPLRAHQPQDASELFLDYLQTLIDMK